MVAAAAVATAGAADEYCNRMQVLWLPELEWRQAGKLLRRVMP